MFRIYLPLYFFSYPCAAIFWLISKNMGEKTGRPQEMVWCLHVSMRLTQTLFIHIPIDMVAEMENHHKYAESI